MTVGGVVGFFVVVEADAVKMLNQRSIVSCLYAA